MNHSKSFRYILVVCIVTVCFGFTVVAFPGVSLQDRADKEKVFVRHRGLLAARHSQGELTRLGASMGDLEPVPIPGGDQIPDGPFIHSFLPGPTDLGFEGLDVEPNGITNFRGFVTQGYLGGSATDNSNNAYNLGSDIRVYQGEYVSVDGSHHRGTFVLI